MNFSVTDSKYARISEVVLKAILPGWCTDALQSIPFPQSGCIFKWSSGESGGIEETSIPPPPHSFDRTDGSDRGISYLFPGRWRVWNHSLNRDRIGSLLDSAAKVGINTAGIF